MRKGTSEGDLFLYPIKIIKDKLRLGVWMNVFINCEDWPREEDGYHGPHWEHCESLIILPQVCRGLEWEK